MIKVDLHMHSGEDPEDGLRYPATALIEKASEMGFAAIAITLHGVVLEDERVFAFARSKGVLLIRALEWNIGGCDVLLYNITQQEAERLGSFEDLRAFKWDRGEDLLVIAPHPYYPAGHCLHDELERNIDLFDAIEYSQIHFRWLNFNKRAVQVATKYNKPIVANSDTHNLWMFGRHYTMLDAEPTMPSIFKAVKEGRVEWHSPHVTIWQCLRMFVFDHIHRRPGQIVTAFE